MRTMTLTQGWVTCLCAFVAITAVPRPAHAWDEEGHVIVTRLAWEKLPDDMPDWLKTPEVRYRLEYLSAEPDRWRGQRNLHLEHVNNPNHYIDIDDLEAFGMTIMTLPPLRREYLDLMATARALHPDKHQKRDPQKDRNYTRLVPGLLPYEIAELQWKIASSWTTLNTYEKYREYVTDEMISNARENVIYHMGILSHFIGDGAQPLHNTRHHNGWVGDNPKRYTTRKSFHSFIDGGVIKLHGLKADNMASLAKPPRRVTKTRYWRDICQYLNESFELVEPLYALEKSGELKREAGKVFIQDRLAEGGAMLAGTWHTAYRSAVIDEFRVKRLLEAGKLRKPDTPKSNGE